MKVPIKKALTEYCESIRIGIRKLVDKTTSNLSEKLKEKSPRRARIYTSRRQTTIAPGLKKKKHTAGSYARSWDSVTTVDSFSSYEKTVRNRDHYQLTHLLEKGHKNAKGGVVSPRVHIAPEENAAIKRFETDIEKLIENSR
jgi:hypothetical protein